MTGEVDSATSQQLRHVVGILFPGTLSQIERFLSTNVANEICKRSKYSAVAVPACCFLSNCPMGQSAATEFRPIKFDCCGSYTFIKILPLGSAAVHANVVIFRRG